MRYSLILIVAAAASTLQAQPVAMNWARSETQLGYASLRYTDVQAHSNGNFLIIGEAQPSLSNFSNRRIYASMMRPDGTRVWTQIFQGQTSTSPVYQPKARIMPSGEIILVARGEASGFVKRLDPNTGAVNSEYFPLSPGTQILGADIGHDGFTYFAYPDDPVIRNVQTTWTDSFGVTYVKKGIEGLSRINIQRVSPANVVATGAIQAASNDFQYFDYPGGTIRRGTSYSLHAAFDCKFLFRFNGDPSFVYFPSKIIKQFLGWDSATGTERSILNTGRSVWMAKLNRTATNPVSFSSVNDLVNNPPTTTYFLGQMGLQPDYDINAKYVRTTNNIPSNEEFQLRLNGSSGTAGDPLIAADNFETEDFMNGAYYRTVNGDALSNYTKYLSKWLPNQATPVWMLYNIYGASRLPWQTLSASKIIDGTGEKLLIERTRDSDGANMDFTTFAVRPTLGGGVAQRVADGATLVVGEVDLAAGGKAGWVGRFSQAPVATPDARTTVRNTTLNSSTVLSNDRFPTNASALVQRNPSRGTLAFNANGTFSYTPQTNWVGTDSFDYKLVRGGVSVSVGRVNITVTP